MEQIKLPWPEWQIVETLGRGAFGEVYRAKREDYGETFYAAVKVVRIPGEESEIRELEDTGIGAKSYLGNMVNDLVGEIALMHRLKGASHIVSIEDYKIIEKEEGVGWTLYIRMELLTNLNEYKREHPLSEEEVIKLGCHMCDALEMCQKEKIVHRDIKPSNVFVSKFGDFKLGDFGISRHLGDSMSGFSSRKGTGSYMAPEIYRGENYDFTVDIYSLGIMLFQLANEGRLPFLPPAGQEVLLSDTEAALERRLSGEDIPDPSKGGRALGDIIRKACNIDPRKRYQMPSEMKKDLLNCGSCRDEKKSNEQKTVSEEDLTVVIQNKKPKLGTYSEDTEEKTEKSSRSSGKKGFIIAAVLLAGAAAVGGSILLKGSNRQPGKTNPPVSQEKNEASTEMEKTGSMAVELTKNDPDITEIFANYFQLLQSKNVKELMKVTKGMSEESFQSIKYLMVEDYQNIETYSVEGPKKDSRICYVLYEKKIAGINTSLPCLVLFYLKPGDGTLKITGKISASEAEYINQVSGSDAVAELKNNMVEKRQKALDADKDLQEIQKYLTGETEGKQVTVNTGGNGLRIRKAPVDGEVITKIADGLTALQIVRLSNDWSMIQYEETVGFAAAEYLSEKVKNSGEDSNPAASNAATGSGTSSSKKKKKKKNKNEDEIEISFEEESEAEENNDENVELGDGDGAELILEEEIGVTTSADYNSGGEPMSEGQGESESCSEISEDEISDGNREDAETSDDMLDEIKQSEGDGMREDDAALDEDGTASDENELAEDMEMPPSDAGTVSSGAEATPSNVKAVPSNEGAVSSDEGAVSSDAGTVSHEEGAAEENLMEDEW